MIQSSDTKKCNTCHEVKPLAAFSFRKDTGKYKNQCRRCKSEQKRIDRTRPSKVCRICGEEKSLSGYAKAGAGYQSYCKPCDKKRKQQHYRENYGRIRSKHKQYYQENKDAVKTAVKEYRVRERDRVRAYWNWRSATDINYRLSVNIRTRIRCALKPKNAYKADKTERLLGCSIGEFRAYFESLFTDGMTWDLFLAGEIHIDHIKPCVLFDLTKEDEQYACFNYTNLQPLWKLDNLKKGITYQSDTQHGNTENSTDLRHNDPPSRSAAA